MKRYIKVPFLLILAVLFVSGCFLKSVHSLVGRGDGKNAPGFEGVWESEDGSRWYFINDMNNYRIYMGSDDKPYTENTPGGRFLLDGRYDTYYVTDAREFNFGGPMYGELVDGRDTTAFYAATIELNGNYYLDLYPNIYMEEMMLNHIFPMHSISKITIEGNSLQLEPFDDNWMREQILNNRIRLKHELVGEANQYALITASTEELQEFVIKYGNEENAYGDPIILNRIQ